MLENENMAVNTASTPEQQTPAPQQENVVSANPNPSETTGSFGNGTENNSKEHLYTKDQIVKLMEKRVRRSHKSFFDRYGVADLKGLDELFNKTKQYDEMNSAYSDIMLKNAELTQTNAFLRNNINPERYDDIKAYFKGTGIEFSEEALLNALTKHPEWLKQQPAQVGTTTIRTLGTEAHSQPTESDEAKMQRIFGKI